MENEFCEDATQGQVTAHLENRPVASAPHVLPVRCSRSSVLSHDLCWGICWGNAS